MPELMEVFSRAREIMRTSGNMNQWNDGYPSENIVMKDIDEGVCYVLCKPDMTDGGRTYITCKERIIATMAFIPGPDPTYAKIYEGQWIDDSPYYVIHRIAAAEPGNNAAATLLTWALTQTGNIRIDTHKDNAIMHHILQKHGFTRCGVIHLLNGAPREAFQKNQSTTRCTQNIEHQHVK